MKKRLVISLIFSLIVYFIFIKYFLPENFMTFVNKISFLDFTMAVIFMLLSLFFEFLRWNFYLTRLGVKIKIHRSLMVFLSGLAFGFMPAKSGEMLRFVLLRRYNVSFRKTVPIHFISNLTSFFVVLIFCSPVLLYYGETYQFIIIIILLVLIFFSFRYYKHYSKLLDLLKNFVNLKIINHVKKSIKQSNKLMDSKNLFISFVLTLLYYSCTGISFFFIAHNFESHISSFIAFSIYSISLIIGVLSMLPGGIGAVEGGSIILLSQHMNPSNAFVIIFLMRLLSFWFTIILGIFILNAEIFTKKSEKRFSLPKNFQ